MSLIKIVHTTGSGNKYPLEVHEKVVAPKQVSLLDGDKVEYCGVCPNNGRNGGCSWIAPDFDKLSKNYPRFHVIAIKSGYEAMLVYPRMALYHKMINLERLTANILIRMSAKYTELSTKKSYLISCGNCRSCRSKICTIAAGDYHCAHPSKRRYSMEAVGINVSETVKKQLKFDLLWYEKGSGILPDYLTRVCGVLTTMSKSECQKTLTKTLGELMYI